MQPNQAEKYEKRRKYLLIASIIGFFVLVIFIIIAFILDSQKTATVDVLVAPSFSQIEIDGHKLKTVGQQRLKPGEYIAKISADGFETQEIPITLIENEETKLYLVLNPTSDNSDFYDNNSKEANLAQRINEALVSINAELYLKKYPIVGVLPIIFVEVNQDTNTWREFRIDYGEFEQCETDFCLKVTDTNGDNYGRALDQIREKGFNPDDYEIVYEYNPVEKMPDSITDEIHKQYGV